MFQKMMGGEKKPSAAGTAAKTAAKTGAKKIAKMIGTKLLALLAPALPYILISLVAFIAILAAAKTVNDIVSFFTGTDPFVSETTADDIKDLDINGEERLPGLEQADELVQYEHDGTGLEKVETCESNENLLQWLDKKFNGNFADACALISYMNAKGTDLDKKYNNANPSDAKKIELDRGLLVSSFLYSYVYRDKDSETEKEDEETLLSSGDPITIINYMIDGGNGVKIKTEHIDKLYEHQVVELKYLAFEWGVVKTEEIEGVTHSYYGCKTSIKTGYEYDLNLYKLYLRDSSSNIIGSVGSPDKSAPSMNGTGYIGAVNYAHTIMDSTSYCLAGDPSSTFNATSHLMASSGSDYVTMAEAQAFIKAIRDSNKNDPSAFLVKANYGNLDADNLTFTYNNTSYTLNYDNGFMNKNFSFFKKETNAAQKPKSLERVIDIVFNNAVSLNKSLNFPYHDEEPDSNVTSIAIVIGDEAAPLGDFPWILTSTFGPRGPVEGVPNASRNHGAIDMAGYNISGSGVYAWKAGTVYRAGWSSGCGNYVRIEHETLDGSKVQSLYCHMIEAPLVSQGDTVQAGTIIGKVGSTGNSSGPHLHFGIEVNGTPVDPCPYINVGRKCEEAH